MFKDKTVRVLLLAVFFCLTLFWLYFAVLWQFKLVFSEHYVEFDKQVFTAGDSTDVEKSSSGESIIFVGDIMLGRHVEEVLNSLGSSFVYKGIQDIFIGSKIVANFEASVPVTHQPTPDFTFQFSVDKKFLPALSESGITHLSLANNHSLDHGQDNYDHTVFSLSQNGLSVFGHPTRISTSSVSYIDLAQGKVSVIGISNLFLNPRGEDLEDILNTISEKSDWQVAYVHWGEEYELVHNEKQEELAKWLIDRGIDVVIAHHPHVVQDIWRYGDGLVVYSLGNFIFDQFWNDEVREGLIVELRIIANDLQLSLVPIESKTVSLQPRVMGRKEGEAFLASLAKRSDPTLSEDIAKGRILLQF